MSDTQLEHSPLPEEEISNPPDKEQEPDKVNTEPIEPLQDLEPPQPISEPDESVTPNEQHSIDEIRLPRPTHLATSVTTPDSPGPVDIATTTSIPQTEVPDVTDPVTPVTPVSQATPTLQPEEKARQAEKKGSLPRMEDVGTPSLFAEQITSGVTFEMYYLGTTKLTAPSSPTKSQHLQLCREVMSRIKMPPGEPQPLTPISVFISTRTLQLLDPSTGIAMIKHALPSISYISDIRNNLVIMARNGEQTNNGSENGNEREEETTTTTDSPSTNQNSSLVCHLLESQNSHNVAVTMGHAFNVAYRQFLRSSGINEDQLAIAEYTTVLTAQKMPTEHLESLTNNEKQRLIILPKKQGEPIGVMLIESGWGSMLPTCVIGHMAKSGPAALSNKVNIGDHVIRLCGQSLVGMPLEKCMEIARAARNLTKVSMELASCNPVVEVNIIRPDVKFPLGFTVQDGEIVSLSRGSISDRSGVRVGHKIIEINGQSTINMKHKSIVTLLQTSIGELLLKTMPIALYKLTLGLEQPVYV
ncbi:Amyloid beta A4 precursor protein-binding family A member 1 [Oopsacas minuta]|uniref:Amyloid beta A4 protein-binding family A member 1 n=1 Tax=Oopsacas minuta TaxID=111878 RepID=A0AAV7JFP0_9METZ|nr:Amyloid beta A4 precursor protein-binding family A member 1 [Oopsacas minuta]